ncbi:MAG: hypothetical protein IK088_09200 [Lachnospiraceae bacterium]|nr:hypothetical protein [Lachnospiraceae bacterium]
MKKSLFHSTGRFYKANLHMHTTVSDGALTPEEIKAEYQKHGYSILAYSDHEILVPHPELADDSFLPLTAIEIELKQPSLAFHDASGEVIPSPPPYLKRNEVYHFVMIAPKANETYYPWATRSYVWGNAKEYIQDYYVGEKPRTFSYENANAAIKDAKDHGYLVTYCHPFWSCNHFDTFAGLENVDFVEIFNNSCVHGGYVLDDTDRTMEDFLHLGKHVSPTCSDDCHSMRDLGGGATYIKADSLSYEDVYRSLKCGDTFASKGPEGPVFKDIQFDTETKKLYVESSPVRQIALTTGVRFAKANGKPFSGTVDSAEFDLESFIDNFYTYGVPERAYVRLTLTDESGMKAYSRGYFLPELMAL